MIIDIDTDRQVVGTGDLMLTRFGHRMIVECDETGKHGVMCPKGKVHNMMYDTLQKLLNFYEPNEVINSKRLKLITVY